jgi:hypothetical protein
MTKYIYGIFVAVVLGTMGCKDQLDIGNPNAPTLSANVNTETGVISLAQGGVYINGFLNGDTWLGNSYFSLPMGYNELMADNVGASASNNQVTTVGQPDYIILDDGTKMTNTSPSVGILRTYNTRAATGAGNNAIHYQWLNMYALNNACNLVLSVVDEIPFTGDAASKANTIKAWCYWWKGFAYASIGTKYYAGLIVNEYGVSSNDYVLHDAILNESNTYFNLAATTLSSISSASDYSEVLVQLIPSHTQVGNGGVPTIDMWKRNINTMLARNILLNKLSPFVNNNPDASITQSSMSGVMTDADWNAVKTLATDGIQESDIIFTGRTTGTNDFFSATGGTVASLTATNVSTATFKVSERVIQNFKTGDKRFDNNFNTNNRYSNDYIYTTRYNTVNGGNGIEGVFVYADRDAGEHELIIAGSYEENALMLAEANIRLDDIDAGLSYIDDVRDYFGAGLTAVSGTGLTVSEALSELTKERRVALLFRGLSYYDSRRWGWTYDISKGGGSYGNTIVQGTVVNTNAIINYNFMDYWDVPANESALNPPSESSVAVENPNY